MRVRSLRQLNLRNLLTERLTFEDGVTAVVGPNAAGKSNLLEALTLGLEGRGAGTKVADSIRFGCDAGYVCVEVETAEGLHRIEVGLSPGRRQVSLDGQPVRAIELARLGGVVLIAPDDLELVHGPPARRRAFLDHLLGRLSLRYALVAREYHRVVDQRNALLRGRDESDVLATWDARFVALGREVWALRARATASLAASATSAYDRIAGGEHGFEVQLRRSGDGDDLAVLLEESRASERERGVTLVGPHRDDLELLLGGHSVQAFASRGEARTAALALRVAERALLEARHGTPPLLLVDDVQAELDERRRRFLVTFAESAPQAVVTGTETPVTAARIWRIDAGRIERATSPAIEGADGR